MYDELIKRLRTDAVLVVFPLCDDITETADAIEELVRKEKFHAFLWNTIQPNEMEVYLSMYNAGDEKGES